MILLKNGLFLSRIERKESLEILWCVVLEEVMFFNFIW